MTKIQISNKYAKNAAGATCMVDADGQLVPLKYVNRYDKKADAAARSIMTRFFDLRARLEKSLAESINDMKSVSCLKPEEKLGAKGNFQIISFDGRIQIEIKQQYNIRFDERVAKAREMMTSYVDKLLVGVSGDKKGDASILREIIQGAFMPTATGSLPVDQVLRLLRYNVTATEWIEARRLLTDSIKPVKGKRYLRCSYRSSRQQNWQPIRLALADCWPEEE